MVEVPVKLYLDNNSEGKPSKLFLYKRKYQPLAGHKAYVVSGNVSQLERIEYEGMSDVILQDFLPKELGFDMNMHTLSFEPAGCHPFVETHVQEHGAYLLEGEGIYLLGAEWIQVQKEDFIFFGPYTPQAVYATGRGRLTYIYSKDCNRDVAL